MAKSDKATVMKRVQEVLRLLLAGGEYEDISQYAADRDWKLSERQLRRYMERAYKRLASTTQRDQNQLLGRHLMQRRALYARSLKANDMRTALQVLRDEALLEGLYPSTKSATTTSSRNVPYSGASGPPLSREERFIRLQFAEARKDRTELRLLETATPHLIYEVPDSLIPRQMLNLQALIYVADQLDHASTFFMTLFCLALPTGDETEDSFELVGSMHAYKFKVETDAWQQYTESIGIDSQKLVADNHHGNMLELFGKRIYDLAPTEEAIRSRLIASGQSAEDLPTSSSIAREWRDMLNVILRQKVG
ncbi:MAG: hypothetical protein WD851_12065 [Pirellulales bacterium]